MYFDHIHLPPSTAPRSSPTFFLPIHLFSMYVSASVSLSLNPLWLFVSYSESWGLSNCIEAALVEKSCLLPSIPSSNIFRRREEQLSIRNWAFQELWAYWATNHSNREHEATDRSPCGLVEAALGGRFAATNVSPRVHMTAWDHLSWLPVHAAQQGHQVYARSPLKAIHCGAVDFYHTADLSLPSSSLNFFHRVMQVGKSSPDCIHMLGKLAGSAKCDWAVCF